MSDDKEYVPVWEFRTPRMNQHQRARYHEDLQRVIDSDPSLRSRAEKPLPADITNAWNLTNGQFRDVVDGLTGKVRAKKFETDGDKMTERVGKYQSWGSGSATSGQKGR